MEFNTFLENHEKEINGTISKLPKRLQKILSGYNYVFEPGLGLKGDKKHIGAIDSEKKKITVSAPFEYGRNFCLLHELGHLYYAAFMTKKEKDVWKDVSQITKRKNRHLDNNDEENFCHSFAQHFCQNKLVKFSHPEWEKFMKDNIK